MAVYRILICTGERVVQKRFATHEETVAELNRLNMSDWAWYRFEIGL